MAEISITITIPTEQISTFLSDIAGLMEKHKLAEITAKESSALDAQASAPHKASSGESAPVPRDYFVRDKSGVAPTVAPKDAEFKTVKILQANGPFFPIGSNQPSANDYLRVLFTGGQANCFDPHLFDRIRSSVGLELGLYLTRSGKYTNIAGVRA
jgi:hypothetical protein